MSPMTKDQRRRLIQNNVQEEIRNRLIPGIIGKLESDGSITVPVSGVTNKVWVRLYSADAQAQEAWNTRVVPVQNMPVNVERTNNGLEIIGLDKYRADLLYGVQAPSLDRSVIAEAPDIIIPGRNYKPMRVRPIDDSTLRVHVEPFFYRYAGTLVLWPGGVVDLTDYLPSTSGYWRFVYVTINPISNSLVLLSGDETGFVSDLVSSALVDFDTTGLILLDAVRLQAGQSAFSNDLQDFAYGRVSATDVGGDYMNTFEATISSAYAHVPSGRRALWYGPITITGSLTVDGSVRIIA